MNELNRKKVIAWMKKQVSDCPLEIYDLYGNRHTIKIPNVENLSLDELIYKLIHLCQNYATRYPDTKYSQCHAGAARSVFDIWRMCKYYFPNTSIFDVMHVLYRLVAYGKLHMWKCIVLHQYVFMPQNVGHNALYNISEFGISFDDLKEI